MKDVFLSSVGRDLKHYREMVIEAIEGLDGYHCVCMENFGARDWEADDFCRAKVADCDLFVGITGHVYGSIHEPSGKSFTEREYDAAIEGGKSRLMFLAPEDYPLPVKWIEKDEIRDKQIALRKRVNRDKIRDTFTSSEDLAGRVRQAIHNWEYEQARTDRRSDATPTDILPRSPQPYFAHPYPLQPNFTGRVNERRMLTNWFTTDNRPVFVYEAIGGMGKSAVAWVWVQRDILGFPVPGIAEEHFDGFVLSDDIRPEGVLWWSFYETDAKFGAFLNEALRYTGASSGLAKDASDHDKLQALINTLCQRRFLLVLDGFERELRAYASMNAAYQGERIEQDERGDFRSCVDPRAAAFLRSIAAQPLASRILMTTRLHPRELDNLAGCRHEHLVNMSIDDTLVYFHAQGVTCTRAEVVEACRECGFHPLSLSLLAGIITGSLRAPGDVAAAQGYRLTDDLKGKNQHHILEASYESLGQGQKALLSKLAALRNPITFETAAVFKNEGQSESDYEAALKNLIDRGLIYLDDDLKLDFHPIIRSYAYDRLTDPEGVHSQLRDYFDKVPRPEGKVAGLEELNPVIELYHHTVHAGHFDDASRLYRSRLDALYLQFGAYNLIIELLKSLFPRGVSELPMLSNELDQAYILNDIALAYGHLGQSRRAVFLFEIAVDKYTENESTVYAYMCLGNLTADQLKLGRIRDAEKNLRHALDHFQEVESTKNIADSLWLLGSVLLHRGIFEEAEQELSRAFSMFEEMDLVEGLTVVRSYQAHAALLEGKNKSALDLSAKALNLWRRDAEEDYPMERDRVRVEWILGWSKIAVANDEPDMKVGLLNEAEQHLIDALTRCRKNNMIDYEPDILFAWARWHRAKGVPEEARKSAEEARDIADSCEYRLKQADIHSFLALLDLEAGNLPEAKRHADIGLERAECDGPPYHYKPAYEESERLLTEIAAKSK